jgi:hypothetical protein
VSTAAIRRSGVALAAALGLLALLGILIAGAVASSTAARRAVWLAQSDAVLAASADYALGSVLASWQESLLFDLPLGVPRTVESTIAQTVPVHVGVTTTRLPDDVLWIVGDAWTGGLDQGRRRFGLVARFSVPGGPPPAGIVARGGVSIGAGVLTSIDTSGEADCAAGQGPNVIVAPSSTWTTTDSVRVSVDARAADSATYYLTSRQVASLDSAIGVRRVAGDTTIAGGSYQGILLVDGALRIAKPVVIVGLVIARGPIEASDSLRLTGAMLSFASSPQTAISLSSGTIDYAPCIVARELRRASPPRPVRERSWSEIF